ncbi:MAG: ECF transporter S component [Candidatus Hodarchaeota archaeon]
MIEESKIIKKKKSFSQKSLNGYFIPNNTLLISMIGIFTALNFAITFWIQIPIPATGGYINIGDVAVMFTALLFGPIIGGIAGGLGPMLADIFTPYVIYAPATLFIKGIEGFLIGLIANPKDLEGRVSYRDIIAVLIGGLLIPLGYFIYEAFILNLGVLTAVAEVPGNFFQFGFAALASILLILASRKNIIDALPQVFNKVFVPMEVENIINFNSKVV